jgi:hypothetical protein
MTSEEKKKRYVLFFFVAFFFSASQIKNVMQKVVREKLCLLSV